MDSTANQFSIKAINNSSQSGSFMLFQRDRNMQQNVFSLAWMTQFVQPRNQTQFSWGVNYNFVSGQTGSLRPGVKFNASELVGTNLTNGNAITLAANGFTNQMNQSPTGKLYIKEDSSIPMGSLSVGIGMSNAPTFVTQAMPNTQVIFTPTPEYWIAFGNYEPGEVLDTQRINNCTRIEFNSGVTAMNVTFNQDGSWNVSPY